MIKVDRTKLNLIDIFTHMSIAITLSVIENFTQSRDFLQKGRDYLVENTFEFGEHVEEISALDEQISITTENIKQLTNALLCHESKCIEKRMALKDLQSIGLN